MSTIEERIEQVRNDREHGSRWLVRETILILHDIANNASGSPSERKQRLYDAGRSLALARPSMAAIASVVGRILSAHNGTDAIAQEAERLLQGYDTATAKISEYAKSFLHGTIMTCSVSGTVLDVLIACRQAINEVIVTEGRPRYEGRVMANALSQQGIAVTLITDAQADIFIPICDSVVVGADTVLANGDVLNKAGTALLARSARDYTVPVYVLCETLKISPQRWQVGARYWQTNLALLEEKEGREVLEQPGNGVRVRNFYFDHTPHHLIAKVITEQGVLDEQEIANIAHQVAENRSILAF